MMTKADVLVQFRELWRDAVRARPSLRGDDVARREAWNDYTDALQKDGLISTRQYDTWSGPFRNPSGSVDRRRPSALMPAGTPRYVHVYDNGGKTADRYTIVFTGRYRHKTNGSFVHLGASAHPFHPQGVGMHGESRDQIDYPSYGHLGKKIGFKDLPPDVQKFVVITYKDIWSLK